MNFDNYIELAKDELIKSTQEVIRIPSVKDSPCTEKPFGENINRTLEYMLNLGKSMGFKTKNLDGYAGYIEYGEGKDMVGILAHLDVVPEGTGWTYPPYGAEIHENKIYGRGTIDDKGPAVAALYAMKAVKDSKVKINKRIRLILGLDEESGWGGMKHYKKVEEIPTCAFTPDSNYPVIYAEKGIVNYRFYNEIKDSNSQIKINSIKGGNRPNMVADYCEAIIEVASNLALDKIINFAKDKVKDYNFNIEVSSNDNNIIFKSHGISAHGSTPAEGVNAITQLIIILYNILEKINISNNFIEFYYNYIGLETNGKSLGCSIKDEISGELTFNVGTINVSTTNAEFTANIRYPVTSKEQSIYDKIKACAKEYSINVEKKGHQLPLLVPKNSPLVQKLMKVYIDVTGDTTSKPISIGGGTYARGMDNAVAFGAVFPDEVELAHQKDEYITIDSLLKNSKIFARAIYELTK